MRSHLFLLALLVLVSVCFAELQQAEADRPRRPDDMGLDKLINSLIKGASKGKTHAQGKTTIMQNANTLTHDNADNSVDPEELLKKTAEEGKKVSREDNMKEKNEEVQKRKEETSKVQIKAQKAKIREESDKQQAEQDVKTTSEQRKKLAEVQEKKAVEQRNKVVVQKALARAEKEKQDALNEMDQKKLAEENQKKQMEQQSKNEIQETQQKAIAARQRAADELVQKKKAEEEQKEQQVKRTQQEAEQGTKNEQNEKRRKANALGRTCNCQQPQVNFGGSNTWQECPDGYLMTGIYRGDSQALNSVAHYQCCQPCQEDGRTVMKTGACSQADWVASFDRAGWSKCPTNSYVKGLYKSSCDYIYCIEYARCCPILESKGENDCNAQGKWGLSFDRAGWSIADAERFISGFYRSNDQWLYAIEHPLQCRFFSFNMWT